MLRKQEGHWFIWKEHSVRGRAPETQVSADLCGHSVQRWLGTINIDMKVMVTPRSGVSVDDDEDDGVGDKWTTAFGSIYIRTANLLWAPSDVSVASDTAPALSLQRVPSSSSTVQGGPSSTTPVLLSCVDYFDTAPPPYYPACLAPLCLLSCVNSFDTAPPPQDLLAGLLYTAPPPSTGIGELVDTSREHGRSAVSMETMDSYGFTCKGGPGPYARRARHSHEEDQAQGAGTATKGTKLKEHADGYHSGARETRAKGTVTGQREGAMSKESTQLRRHRGAKQAG
ncbi:uncharacterized protein UDID_18657 [Ustilago sp. UG-2017a]|nr:uncharacterized protein UDID_18657 [Ustilago sp. UG-2017a]